ncbi:4-(cytidine 5'-diphospho)-2-C-methyl-D-erythritol kinase [Marinilabilia rubra]|uniref:4-(cytidine 5'-diphospho)-2-C-methyl-D-erythritol kinase n=1 Tax=Marinilabilia rubra TaxID=2162893 RepID=UPI0018E092EE|nr:4-(cytidine 5'-diphospho)-2-C-methyl-D-erythritol kinase [Marinilabilia rubra]
MVVFPNAKINLGLFITEKRPDGFHNIETAFFPVKGFTDVLEVIENTDSSNDGLSTSGIPTDAKPEDNLVIKALKLLRNDHQIPSLKIHLHKAIPSGAGLGGGSSDAAFMLNLLNQQFKLGISTEDLEKKAAKLGADCAFFIRNTPTIATGIGNEFQPVTRKPSKTWIELIIPPIHLSTPEAYQNIKPQKPYIHLDKILTKDPEIWKDELINDFEENAFTKHTELRSIKEMFYNKGAFYSAMSGSGSAVFGLFRKQPEIEWPEKYITWSGEIEV